MVRMSRHILATSVMVLLLGLSSGLASAQVDERALDAERRALDAEGRALQAERRALEIERRAIEADPNASGGASLAPSETQPDACQAATRDYETICSIPSRDSIGDAPECAAAQAGMRRLCGPN
jgi:hypothetical protein